MGLFGGRILISTSFYLTKSYEEPSVSNESVGLRPQLTLDSVQKVDMWYKAV